MEASVLKEILEQHKLWIDGKGGKRANLGGAYLGGANLGGANLGGANLTAANLNCADLRDADLTGADLTGANLKGANLKGASLKGASLTRVVLRGANLMGADLTGASLTFADLKVANLKSANLGGADLTGANLQGADFYNTILQDISWIIPGCLAHLNNIMDEFYLEKEGKWKNFIQDSFGFIIQNNPTEGTFDMLAGDRIIRNIPHWVKYSGLKQIESESV